MLCRPCSSLMGGSEIKCGHPQEFMVKLAERCKEQKEKTLEKLKEKYLGPLNPNAKKVCQMPHIRAHAHV